jgi:hypothetical protein
MFLPKNAKPRERPCSFLSHFSVKMVGDKPQDIWRNLHTGVLYICRSHRKRKIKKCIIQCILLLKLYVVDNARYMNQNCYIYLLLYSRGGLYRELSVLTDVCRETNSDNHEWTRTKIMLGKVRLAFMPRYEPSQMIQNTQADGCDGPQGFVLTTRDSGVMTNSCGSTVANISWCKRMWRD